MSQNPRNWHVLILDDLSCRESPLGARMIEIRDSMRGLFGDKYAALIEPYKSAIRNNHAAHPEMSKLSAALDVCKYTATIDDGVGLGLCIAAAVDECDQ